MESLEDLRVGGDKTAPNTTLLCNVRSLQQKSVVYRWSGEEIYRDRERETERHREIKCHPKVSLYGVIDGYLSIIVSNA
jgi:hypothetical protein